MCQLCKICFLCIGTVGIGTVSLVAADLSGGMPTGRVLRLYKEPWGARC